MPFLATDDGVRLYYEEAGSGTPVVFVHEFAGDARSWEPQMRYFARRYRAIAYNARGYPPSDVPEEPERYSQARARDDLRAVLDALGIARAHVVGLSMGAFATLHFGMAYGHRALSLVVAGCGYGAHPAHYAQFQAESRANAEFIRREGMARFAAAYGYGPTRVQLLAKDPRGFEEFIRGLAEQLAARLGEHAIGRPGAPTVAL
ncbi:MAG: alpha/beta fold hydrolase [Burkholderiales bacterium]|nr:alpha/beta fold hydrolase [Burkholderiales bacterium]